MDRKQTADLLRELAQFFDSFGALPIIKDTHYRTSGNLSARGDGGFLITQSECDKLSLKPENLVLVTEDGASPGTPSREWRIHARIYRDYLAIMFIAHTHSNLLLNFSTGIPETGGFFTAASEGEADEMLKLIALKPIVNSRDHGQILIAPSAKGVRKLFIDSHASALATIARASGQ